MAQYSPWLAFFQWLGMMATKRFGQNASLNQNSLQNICCCLFHNVYLIVVDGTQQCQCIVLEIQPVAQIRADILCT